MNAKLIVGIMLVLLAAVWMVYAIAAGLSANAEYENNISAHWELADRSSTIAAKTVNVDKFVAALEAANLHGTNSAVAYPTVQTSFDANFEALKTLQGRLHEIEKMDPASFQYQTAIQQITQQEQGEAQAMLKVFDECWTYKTHYWQSRLWPLAWIGCWLVMFIGGGVFIWQGLDLY